MAIFFLSYNIKSETINHSLIDELHKYGAVQVTGSTWCFDTDDTSSGELRDHFRQFIDTPDELLIVQPRTWAAYNTDGSPNTLAKKS